MGTLRQWARDVGLIFCGAVAAYLLSVLLVARLGPMLSGFVEGAESRWLHVFAGVLAMDVGKAPGLLLVAYVLARAVRIGPVVTAAGLTLGTYSFDILISLLLGQFRWLWGHWAVATVRSTMVVLLVVLTAFFMRWCRRRDQG